jgi:hypothetical protein
VKMEPLAAHASLTVLICVVQCAAVASKRGENQMSDGGMVSVQPLAL